METLLIVYFSCSDRLVPSIVIPKETMIDTMIEHATRRTGQDYVLIAPTLLVIVPETEAMCTKDLIRNGFGIRTETETIGLLVKESDQETQIGATTTIGEDPQRKSHNESVIGQNTSARRERNITTIANQKSLNGKNLATGLIGRRKRNTSATESATDVIGIVIVNESTTDNPIRRLVIVVARLKDIPILVVLVLCRIVTIIAVAVVVMWHHLVLRRIEIIIELISLSHRCRNSRSPEDTATVCCITNELT